MQMIDVLKRLAELDANNPQVEKTTLKQESSLATISNVAGEPQQVNECGPMGMDMSRPSTPASFSINASAASGAEVSSMLKDIMNLAGVGKEPMSGLPHAHGGLELGAPHAVEIEPVGGQDDSMADMISMIDKMNGPSDEKSDDGEEPKTDEPGPESLGPEGGESDSPVADMADEVRGMADEMSELTGDEEAEEEYDNSPDEKVEPHKFGNDQVKPQPQGLKQRLGDNPYTQTEEAVAQRLMNDYKKFMAEAKAKCSCEEKGKKTCPVHGKMDEGLGDFAKQAVGKGMAAFKSIKKDIGKKITDPNAGFRIDDQDMHPVYGPDGYVKYFYKDGKKINVPPGRKIK